MFVRARVKEGVKEEAILVPQQSVSRDPKGNPFAWVVDPAGSQAELRKLTLDRAVGARWLVSSGLSRGDQVIVEGMQRIRPGAAVHAVPFVEETSRAAVPNDTPATAGEAG